MYTRRIGGSQKLQGGEQAEVAKHRVLAGGSQAHSAGKPGTIYLLCFNTWGASGSSARLEEEDGHLSEVEIDEVLGLMGNVRSEVSTHDTVPGGVVLLVEFLLDEGSDILFDVEFLQGLGRDIDCVLLHVLRHVSVLNDCLTVRHLLI